MAVSHSISYGAEASVLEIFDAEIQIKEAERISENKTKYPLRMIRRILDGRNKNWNRKATGKSGGHPDACPYL
jgi:hypothetical protein